MERLGRREFMRNATASLAAAVIPRLRIPDECREDEPLSAPLGRIATWWRQAVRTEPSPKADVVAWKTRDNIIPLYAALAGEAPWPTNPIWYQTEGGYIHSGYVQPVEDRPNGEVIAEVTEPGFWAQVCVPIAEARALPGAPRVSWKLYFGMVYRVVKAQQDAEGGWWYQLREGITWTPGPWLPAWTLRRILPEEISPISPGRPDKRIEINVEMQLLTCYEGTTPVFSTRVATGLPGTATPKGEHRILYKRVTQRMIGGSGSDHYDLPGISFPVYFTWSGVAIHGTYWHNDYGRRHSHGCVNVTHQASQWVFRWVDPPAAYTDYKIDAPRDAGIPVSVV